MSKKQDKPLTEQGKWVISLEMVVLFFIIANPFTYRLVNKATSHFGVDVCDANGCPTTVGLVVHAIVFGLLVRALMYVPIPN